MIEAVTLRRLWRPDLILWRASVPLFLLLRHPSTAVVGAPLITHSIKPISIASFS